MVDDQIIGQSCAMARYAAKVAGLYPSDEIEALPLQSLNVPDTLLH